MNAASEDAREAPAGRGPREPRGKRWWLVAAAVLGALAVPVLGFLVALHQPRFATGVANAILARLPLAPRSTAHVREVRVAWLTRIEVHDLRVARGDTVLAALDAFHLRYRLLPLLTGRIAVEDLDLRGVRVSSEMIDTTGPARRPSRPSAPLTAGEILRGRFYRGPALSVERVRLADTRYVAGPSQPDSALEVALGLQASRIRLGGVFSFRIDSLALSARNPGKPGVVDLALAAALDAGRFELRTLRMRSPTSDVDALGHASLDARDSLSECEGMLRAHPLDLADLTWALPGHRLAGLVTADLELEGARRDRLAGTLAVTVERAIVDSMEIGALRLEAKLADGRADTRLSATIERAKGEVTGWLRPLDRSPAYDLRASLDRLPARLPGLAWWGPLAARAQAGVTLHVRGTGFTRPKLEVTGRIDGEIGRLDLDGGLDLTGGLGWSVRRLAFEELDVARIAGDTTVSAVAGRLVAGGRDSAGTHRITAALDLAPSRYGAWDLTSASVRASTVGPDVRAALRLESSAGNIDAPSLSARLDSVGSFRVGGARFVALDLGRLARNPALASRLDGTLSAQVRGWARPGGRGGPSTSLRNGRITGDLALDLSSSRFRAQEDITGSVRVALARGELSAAGGIASPAGGLQLDARGRPFDAPAVYDLSAARFADVDLAAWTGSGGLASKLSGTLSARGHPVSGARSEAWDGTLTLLPSRFAGARLEGGDARASLVAGEARLAATLRAAGDTASLDGTFTLGGSRGDGAQRGGEATLSVPFGMMAAFLGRDSLVSRGGLDARVTVSDLGPGDLAVAGRVTGRGAIDRLRVDSLVAAARLGGGSLVLDSLVAGSNVGTVTGAGRVVLADTSASSTLGLDLAVRDPMPLKALLRADTLALGEGRVSVRLGGSAAQRTVETRAVLRSLAYDRMRVLATDATARGTLDRGFRPVRGEADLAVRRVHGGGLSLREVRARARLEPGTVALDLDAAIDETHTVRAAGEAHVDSAVTRATLARLDIQADTVAWSLRHPSQLEVGADRLAVREFDLVASTGHVTADGVIDRRGTQRFKIEARDVGLDFLSAWTGRAGMNGTLAGDLALEGPAAAPRARGGVDIRLLSHGRPFATLRSGLVWDNARLEVEGRYATLEGDSLAWDARLPLALSLVPPEAGAPSALRMFEGAIDVRVRAAKFPLQALAPLLDPRAVSALEGTLDVDARLSGDQRALAGSGRLELSDGLVRLPGLGVTYQAIALASAFEGDRLVLRRAHMTSEKGRCDATGDIRFVSATRIEPRVHLESSRFVFTNTPDLRAMGSTRLDIAGTLIAPVVTGSLTIENSTYTMVPAGQTGGSGAAEVQLTDDDVRMMEEAFGYERTSTTRGQLPFQIYDASDLDLAVTLERNNWIRQRVQPRLSVALTGTFKLRKPPHAEPQLNGRIEPVADRGYVEQFARSFDITGGEVLLNGPMTAHAVDIQAQYKPPSSSESSESEVVVLLEVQGTIDNMKLTLSSEPPMSEGDIVSFIVTGRSPTTNPAGSDASSAALAKDIGLSQVTGPAQAAAQEAIGLDVLQVRFDPVQGATLVAGRYVDPKLYVGFRQPLQYKDTSSPTSTTTYRTSFELEYAIHRWLVFNLQGETSKLRSFIRARHAY